MGSVVIFVLSEPRQRLRNCPDGMELWQNFEDTSIGKFVDGQPSLDSQARISLRRTPNAGGCVFDAQRLLFFYQAVMKFHPSLVILIAGLISSAIWALSPSFTGHREPWDADSYYYVAALLSGGLISGLTVPRTLWAHYVGSLLGQMGFALLFIQAGSLFVVGLGFLLMSSLLFLASAFVGTRLRLRFHGRAPEP
jgi:hypothetical protein